MERFVQERVHGNDYTVKRFYPDAKIPYKLRDDKYLHCAFCGSYSPEDAIKILKNPFGNGSGSDWKYGYPHKFYIGDGKFYTRHLYDATEEEFRTLVKLLRDKLGIWFKMDPDKGIYYATPYGGYQTWYPSPDGAAPQDHVTYFKDMPYE